ncbi:DUF4349 domain-containing protein [Nocardioides acrostichi]|uniref:DUF4349 domain-containing protein n=1 Tax=Nocardioides acrostichi TaxID=2784339 RepID=A0A930Y5T5_9ACTN|nr:DUF4349 domain-containing protein [Nocardioides acrostichi]MBF4160222.1 DUF4349 domain-containing protein [Nocardioides acrostichi]
MNPTSRPGSTRTRRLLLGAATTAVLALCGAACSSDQSADSAASDSSVNSSDARASRDLAQAPANSLEQARANGSVAGSAAASTSDTLDADTTSAQAASTALQPAIISTGTVGLRAKDVGDARFEVQKIVDRFAGSVTDSDTETDDDGQVRRSRLVLRIPSKDFTEAMDALEKVATLESSTSTSEDVTGQVVDTGVRIRVQRASIDRIETLLDRAGSIRDVVSVENELTQREAKLNTLLRHRAYLADQTSMSTITVHLERIGAAKPMPVETDESGFLAGLDSGWHAFTGLAIGLATVAGAVLPFGVLALLLGVPAWVIVRRRRPRLAGPAPAAD